MEDLIKGLVHIALDTIDGEPHAATAAEDDEAPEREVRDRSTWAEVVGAGHTPVPADGLTGERPSRWDEPERRKKEDGRIDIGEQEVHGNRHRRPQPPHDEPSNDGVGLETVGGDGRRHHQVQQHRNNVWSAYKRPSLEQDYSDDVLRVHGRRLDVEPTREELESLSKACARLWDLDLNRLTPEKDYKIELGGGKKVYQACDMAAERLFSWVGDDALRRPTVSRLCALLDNYSPREGFKEVHTAQEQQEQAAFVEEISRMAPIKYIHRYLDLKGLAAHDYEEFKKTMSHLWFELYKRGGGMSSAFEHVFVGEIKGRQRSESEVSGFHNWVQFYLEESKGNVDYQGHIFPRRRGVQTDAETQVLTVQFKWHGVLKSVSSIMIGVSPEFEIALYTLCFFAGGEDNYVELGPYSISVKCYHFGSDKIGSVFPIVQD